MRDFDAHKQLIDNPKKVAVDTDPSAVYNERKAEKGVDAFARRTQAEAKPQMGSLDDPSSWAVL